MRFPHYSVLQRYSDILLLLKIIYLKSHLEAHESSARAAGLSPSCQ